MKVWHCTLGAKRTFKLDRGVKVYAVWQKTKTPKNQDSQTEEKVTQVTPQKEKVVIFI